MRKVASLGLVFLGLSTLVDGIYGLLGVPQLLELTAGEGASAIGVILYLLPGIVMVGASAALILYRDRLSAALFPDESLDIVVSPVPVLRMVLIVLGLWLAATSVFGVLSSVSNRIATGINDQMVFGIQGESRPLYALLADSSVDLAQLVVAWALIAFSQPISSRLWKGRPAKPVPEPVTGPYCLVCGAPYDPADYLPGSDARCVECGAPLDLDGA